LYTYKKLKYILPTLLYGSDTWSFTVSEEHRLREFENRVQKTTFRSRTAENKRRLQKTAQ
jgi:hypothetical protein